jgi:hypothetical protein
MYATIPAREGLNFPNATATDWQIARARLIRFLVAHDLDRDRAEEVAQQHLTELLTKEYAKACPASLPRAISWSIARARRYGIGVLTKAGERTRYRRRAGLEEAQPLAVMPGALDRAPGWTDPAAMAEAGEGLAARMPRLVAHARREGTTPATLALRAAGWGWPQEAATVPSVTDLGPGYTPPAQGCRGLHRDTDPRPAAAVQAQPLTGEALAIYRERLAEHYAR